MPSRSFKAALAMIPVVAVAGTALWLMYAPKGYRYEYDVVSRAVLDAVAQPEQRWTGFGAERVGGARFLAADESVLMTAHEGHMPLLADTARWVREHSDFRTHQRIEVIAENEDVLGHSAQQRLITSDDTLYLTASRPGADVAVGASAEAEAGAAVSADAEGTTVTAPGVTVRVDRHGAGRATGVRVTQGRAARGGRHFVRATHTETYVWTTDEIEPRAGRGFERLVDSLVMLGAHRSLRAIHDKHRGQSEGPYRGVALRVVSTATTTDSLGHTREVVTRGELRDLRRDANAVAWVHRRKVDGVDRRLSLGPPEAVAAPVAPAALPAPPTPPEPARP